GAGIDVCAHLNSRAVVASTAALDLAELGIVELTAQARHPAAVRVLVVEHGLLFALSGVVKLAVARLVVVPRLAGADPPALHAPYRAVDIEHLQHHLK